jgi:hypothetical protein
MHHLESADIWKKDRNPNGLSIAFKIVGGARFVTDAAGWKREER